MAAFARSDFCLVAGDASFGRVPLKPGRELLALLADLLDGVGRQQLRVAERGRGRVAGSGIVAGLQVLGAHAAGLKGVKADDLIARKAELGRLHRVSDHEVVLADAVGFEAVDLLGLLQEPGHGWHRLADLLGLRRRLGQLCHHVVRPGRAIVFGRLLGNVVGRCNGLARRDLGLALLALQLDGPPDTDPCGAGTRGARPRRP